MSREVEAAKLGLKSKEEMHEMSIEELELYEDTLYYNRLDATTMIAYLKKFEHLKLLKAPPPAPTIVEDFTEEEE